MSKSDSLVAKIAATLEDPVDRRLADAIMGSADASAIGAALDEYCVASLGRRVADVRSCVLSVGAAFGITLSDGERIFIKAWSRTSDRAALDATHIVQASLAEQGFPAPRVLVAPVPFMAGYASAMQLLERGAQSDANRPALRRAMAATLARLIALATPLAGLPGLPRHRYPESEAWGRSHSVLFDFAATARGAEWIDEIALTSAAVARHDVGRAVLGHQDWSVKNMRFDDDTVSAVYDWDSLVLAPEPTIVGMAAATFTATWDIPVARVLPTRSDMAAFVRDYEIAAGRAFTGDEWATAGAAATYLVAYTARCEHCTAPEGARAPAGSARAILRESAAQSRTNVMMSA